MSFLAKTKIKTKFMIPPIMLTLLLVILVPFVVSSITNQYGVISNYSKIGLSNSQDLFSLFKELQNIQYKFDRFIKHSSLIRNLGQKNETYKTDLQQNKTNFISSLNDFRRDLKHLVEQYQMQEKHQAELVLIEKNLDRYQQELNALFVQLNSSTDVSEYATRIQLFYTMIHRDMGKLMDRVKQDTQESIASIQDQSKKHMTLFLTVLGICILITLTLGLFLSSYLSLPIQNLSETIRHITASGDYSLRAQKTTEDELGTMIDGFNQMLFEIQRTEESLISTREYLQNIIESLELMLIVTNDKGLIKEINKKALKILNYDHKMAIKNKFIEHVLFANSTEGFKPISFRTLIDADLSGFSPKSFFTQDERHLEVMLSTSVIKDADHKFNGLVLIAYPL